MKSQECLEEAEKTPGHGQPGCLVLYSGGLDSILACRVLQEQGVRVTAVKFITPFFGYEAAGREDELRREAGRKYGLDMRVVDITADYLLMLRNPPHGYGRHFNPCIDCKILMIHKAMEMLNEYQADFIATGEVIGQRPMSQRKDTLNCITKESGAAGFLLRPLCARSLRPTIPEERGWVSRRQLPYISGRGRQRQLQLAAGFGITDYPSPAGGCVLADPIQGRRLRNYFSMWPEMDGNDCCLALTGRHFLLPGGAWLVLGRDRMENMKLASLRRSGDLFLDSMDAPAPAGLIRRSSDPEIINLAASIIMRYCKKCGAGLDLLIKGNGREKTVHVTETADADAVKAMAVDT